MKRIQRTLVAGVALAIFCCGCSKTIVGNWKTDPEPQNEPFYITSATFKDDGSYSAVARSNSQMLPLKGTYEFDGMHLKLKTPGKPDRSYSASYMMVGPTLKLTSDGKKITMKKQ